MPITPKYDKENDKTKEAKHKPIQKILESMVESKLHDKKLHKMRF